MVDFSKKDRIEQLKKLIEQQQEKETNLEKKAEELKKEQAEIAKEKEKVENENKKIDELLEDALDEEEKDEEEKKVIPKRTDVQIQSGNVGELVRQTSEQKSEESEEVIPEKKAEPTRTLYRRTPQNPVVAELYKSLETVYDPNIQLNPSLAPQQQRTFYRELRSIADNMSQQQQEVAPGHARRLEAYGQEVELNPHSRSVNWDKLHDLARKLAESSGSDQHHYQERSEALLNQLRQDFVERAYHAKTFGDEK